jgi:hypothetical protein
MHACLYIYSIRSISRIGTIQWVDELGIVVVSRSSVSIGYIVTHICYKIQAFCIYIVPDLYVTIYKYGVDLENTPYAVALSLVGD